MPHMHTQVTEPHSQIYSILYLSLYWQILIHRKGKAARTGKTWEHS